MRKTKQVAAQIQTIAEMQKAFAEQQRAFAEQERTGWKSDKMSPNPPIE
jgi:hypothetical protein